MTQSTGGGQYCSSSSSFCSCNPPRPSKARWNRHLLCSFVLSQTSRRKTVFFNHRSEIQLSIWMMRNSPRQFWIHHSPFKVVFFCDKEAKSNIVSKFSQFFSTGLCSRSVSPTLFCLPHWNTNLTLSLATAWKLHLFQLDGSSENRSIFLPKDLHPLVCDPSSLPKSCVVGVSDLIYLFFFRLVLKFEDYTLRKARKTFMISDSDS